MFIEANESIPGIVPSRPLSPVKITAYNQQQMRARRGLALFFPLLIAISTLFYWLIIVKHDALAMALFMWTPGSLWPSILLHAAWNGLILEIFDAFTKGADTSIWTGESGLLVAFITMLVAFIITWTNGDTKKCQALA